MVTRRAMSKAAAQRKPKETNQVVLKQAMVRRLPRRIHGNGQLALPAAPGLVDHYVTLLHTTFSQLGRVFTPEETDKMRDILKRKLDEGWKASPYAKIVVSYQTDEPPKTSLSYKVGIQVSTIVDEYDRWVKTRTPPLFGKHPDAK